ncbi:MAG: SH3 domain-containing protein [Chloroflexi bacterium]|nr:SH3 domain-containing protein [Chloroflexota bacterium]
MHEQPQRVLCELIRQYGPELHADARRTEALLRDLAAAYPREIFVLIQAQKQRIPADLLAAPQWMPQQALISQLTHRLQENLALAEDAAIWAIESWAIALAIQPPPPDRAWRWAKQHVPISRLADIRVQLTGKLPVLGKRLFSGFGVKLNQQPPNGLAGSSNRSFQWPIAVAWLRKTGSELRRRRVYIPLLVMLCALSTVGAVNQAVPVVEPKVDAALAVSPAPQALPIGMADPLSGVYPLPRAAWVNEDQLMVRSGPSTATAAAGLLTKGQQLTVLAFTADGQWSRIATPTAGWVSNRYLQFVSEGTPAKSVIVGLEEATVNADSLNVRSGPGTEFPIVQSLKQGQTILIVAALTDGGWKQIIMPSKGWVSTAFVQVSE